MARRSKPRRLGDTTVLIDALHKLPPEQLECRDMRTHAFTVLGQWRGPNGERHRALRCLRCDMSARDILTPLGYRARSRIYDRSNYQKLPGGVETYQIRVEAMRRIKTYPSEAAMRREVFDNNGGRES